MTQLRIDTRHRISDDKLREAWKRFHPSKPMPKIKAYELETKDSLRSVTQLDSDANYGQQTRKLMIEEHGRYVPLGRREGVVFRTGDGIWIILKNKSSKMRLQEVLAHEMNHILEETMENGR